MIWITPGERLVAQSYEPQWRPDTNAWSKTYWNISGEMLVIAIGFEGEHSSTHYKVHTGTVFSADDLISGPPDGPTTEWYDEDDLDSDPIRCRVDTYWTLTAVGRPDDGNWRLPTS